MTMKEKNTQTAGRDQLGTFAPRFAHLNDGVLFGEVWTEETGGQPPEPVDDEASHKVNP